MISCPYERDRCSADNNYQAHCRVLSTAAGFKVTVSGPCEYCVEHLEWAIGQDDPPKPDAVEAPITEAQAMSVVQNSEMFKNIFRDAMRTRMIAGDCELYQPNNPIDFDAALAKYIVVYKGDDAKKLLADALADRLRMARAKVPGCDTAEVARGKIVVAAEKYGLITVDIAEGLDSMEIVR